MNYRPPCAGDLTCLVTLEESHELEARLASRADLVTSGLAILPEAVKVMEKHLLLVDFLFVYMDDH